MGLVVFGFQLYKRFKFYLFIKKIIFTINIHFKRMDEDANDFSSALPHASMNLANIEKSFVSKPCKKSFLIAIFPAQKKVLKNFQSI